MRLESVNTGRNMDAGIQKIVQDAIVKVALHFTTRINNSSHAIYGGEEIQNQNKLQQHSVTIFSCQCQRGTYSGELRIGKFLRYNQLRSIF